MFQKSDAVVKSRISQIDRRLPQQIHGCLHILVRHYHTQDIFFLICCVLFNLLAIYFIIFKLCVCEGVGVRIESLHLLELELQTTVICLLCTLGVELRSSARAMWGLKVELSFQP